ncbi:MAG: exodeoxyribonuclease VII large subunit, partial [Spirochaetota bacterium]|nr:exodeoxyribonuclease VII large subunit [Spirochaetota bacterium]
LKDENAVVKAVMFRFNIQKVRFALENGLKVRVHGSISVYEKRGDYQIVIDHLEPEGIGGLQLAFNQLKDRLEAEGFFDPEIKKPIPKYPERVGIVTSPTGAAIRDILQVMKRRFSSVDVLIYPATVQGSGAGEDIAKQIRLANRVGQADVLIVGRGGGSIEDLWGFNEEVVAKAIYDSDIPVISAVGHEVDYTIADYVADLRAPTPSAAAELVVLSKEQLLEDIISLKDRMNQVISYILDSHKERFSRFTGDSIRRLFARSLTEHRLSLDYLSQSLFTLIERKLDQFNHPFKVLSEKLHTLNPNAIMSRGYSLVYLLDQEKKLLLRNAETVDSQDLLEIQFLQGSIRARVE